MRKFIPVIATAVQQDQLVERGIMTVPEASYCTKSKAAGLLLTEEPKQPQAKRTPRPRFTPEYVTYLKSHAWRVRRSACLARAKYLCEKCGKQRGVQAHHITYVRLGQELPEDLQALCLKCHSSIHKRKKTTRRKRK